MNHLKRRILFLTGTVLTGLVLADVILWWIVSADSSGIFHDVVMLYLDYYPKKLRYAVLLTVLSIVAGLAACICFLRIADTGSGILKKVANVLVVIDLVLVLLHVFSLM